MRDVFDSLPDEIVVLICRSLPQRDVVGLYRALRPKYASFPHFLLGWSKRTTREGGCKGMDH